MLFWSLPEVQKGENNSCVHGPALACTQTFYFSFVHHERRAWENERGAWERKQYMFFFLHHYPLALAVNKSPVVYILSRALDELWRENRRSVSRLALHLHLDVEKMLGKWHSRWIIKTCCAHFIVDGGKCTTWCNTLI